MDINALNNFLISLTASFKNVQVYAASHPLIEKSVQKSIDALDGIFCEIDELTFMVIENDLIVKDFQVNKLAACSTSLARILKDKGVERLSLTKGLQKDELVGFLSSFVKTNVDDTVKATQNIIIGKVMIKTRSARQRVSRDDETNEPLDDASVEGSYELISKAEFERLQDIYSSLKNHKKLNIVGIDDIVGQFISTFKRELSPLLSLATLKSFDEYTYVHAANVCVLTMAQAEYLGLGDDVLHDIGVAAMVHDAGKYFVPEEILNKQGKLTPEEWEIMISHPVQGAKYLCNSPGIPNLAVIVAFEHHMKNDLSGYPKVDRPYSVHPCSKMTNIADFFDALSTVRPYRQPMSKFEIFEMMKNGAGTEFDAFLVENFISMMKETKK